MNRKQGPTNRPFLCPFSLVNHALNHTSTRPHQPSLSFSTQAITGGYRRWTTSFQARAHEQEQIPKSSSSKTPPLLSVTNPTATNLLVLPFLFAMATDAEDLRPPSSSSSVTTSSEQHPPAPLDPEATFPLPPAEVADAEEEDVVGAWGRPISRFGFHRVSSLCSIPCACCCFVGFGWLYDFVSAQTCVLIL